MATEVERGIQTRSLFIFSVKLAAVDATVGNLEPMVESQVSHGFGLLVVSSEGGDTTFINHKSRSTKKGDQEIQKLHEESINTENAALSVWQNKDYWEGNRIIVVFGDIVGQQHSQDVISHCPQMGSETWFRDKAQHGNRELCQSLIAKLHSPGLKSDLLLGGAALWFPSVVSVAGSDETNSNPTGKGLDILRMSRRMSGREAIQILWKQKSMSARTSMTRRRGRPWHQGGFWKIVVRYISGNFFVP